MDNYLDSEVSDSANEIAEAVFTATREHFKGLLPHQEQWLVRGIADVVYLKLRTIYETADKAIQKEVEATEEFRDKYEEAEKKLKPFKSRISEIASILQEQSEELDKISGEFKPSEKLKDSIRKLSA